MAKSGVIHVVDDDAPFRDSLLMLLESHGHISVGHADPEAFLAGVLSGAIRPECALVDIHMPGMSGLELQEALAQAGNTTPLIMLTGDADVPIAVRALKAGALDFIEKPFSLADLLAAIARALERSVAVGANAETAQFQERLPLLTERERQVLDAVVAGHANKVIAYQLGISQRTVEIHRGRVMAKLEITGASNLVRIAVAAGLSPSGSAETAPD